LFRLLIKKRGCSTTIIKATTIATAITEGVAMDMRGKTASDYQMEDWEVWGKNWKMGREL